MQIRAKTAIAAALVAGIGLPWLSPAQAQQPLPNRLQVVVNGHQLPADSYGFHVQEVGDGATILDINSTTPLNPASTMKLLTTLAALEQLGPAYVWHTELYALGSVRDGTLEGDLLVRGGGDPYLLEDQVRNMLKALQRQGVRRISGDLIVDTSYFDPVVTQDGSIDNQQDRAYNVLPNALMSNFQAVTFYFRPADDGQHVEISADPAPSNLRIVNDLSIRPGPCEGYQRGISFETHAERPDVVIFSGRFPAGCREYSMVRAVLTPETFFFGLFDRLWRELGGEFNGSLRQGVAPAGAQPLVEWYSPPLSEVIRYINKFSNNLMTRQTLLTLGAERFEMPATVDNGQNVVGEYLGMLGLDPAGLEVSNGSGLSRDSRISAALLGQVLQHGHESPYMAEFIASLPLNGIDGTMRNRLRSEAMRGNMHIKTGTLDGVSAVAGYVFASSGKQYTVVGMLNHSLADRGPGVELMDALLTWVHEQ